MFVLQEHPGHVFVFAPALDALVAALALEMPGEDGWQRAWAKDKNTRGEALVLLKNGHVLVGKQKKPRLIEFGPREHVPAGISSDTLLSPDEPFEIAGSGCRRWPRGVSAMPTPSASRTSATPL